VKKVLALEVSPTIAAGIEQDGSLEVVLTDGTSIPVPEGSVDVAFSNQLMEHLHPDDALVQLRNIHRALAAGGRYVCFTPSRITGPYDVSRHFDRVATGFHLHEYTTGELVRLFRRVGFRRVELLVRAGRHIRATATWPVTLAETLLTALPLGPRRAIGRRVRPNVFNSIRLMGIK
jgi:SAM-dependent methyltransferase